MSAWYTADIPNCTAYVAFGGKANIFKGHAEGPPNAGFGRNADITQTRCCDLF
jgi:hypothetical protein